MSALCTFAELVDEIRGRPAAVRLVGVDGYGGAGKTTFAARLSRAAGDCPVIHTDDFASHDNPLGWWQRFRTDVVDPLTAGRAARFHRYDWVARRFEAEETVVLPTDVVVLEGVSATRAAWRDELALRIWVQTPRDISLQRGLDRDGMELYDFWQGWMAEEDAYVAREHPQEHADLVADGAPSIAHDPELQFVVVRRATA